MIRNSVIVAALSAAGLVSSLGAARADTAAPLHIDQRVAIDAKPAKVWSIVHNFSDLTWHPVIKSSSATQGNTPGSVRTLDLGGPKLVEQLASYDAAKMSYTYRITNDPANVKVLPVTNYVSTITVLPGPNNTSVAEWQGTFTRADPSASPAAGQDDAAALKAINGVYAGGLAHLKTLAEAD